MILFLACLVIGAVTAYFAYQRGRDPVIWFMLGMFLGILGLILLFLLPPLHGEDLQLEGEEEHPIESQKEMILQNASHEYLIKDWFYLDSTHQQQGPVRFEDLRNIWEEGSISGKSYVWCEGMGDWKKIEELPELKEALMI